MLEFPCEIFGNLRLYAMKTLYICCDVRPIASTRVMLEFQFVNWLLPAETLRKYAVIRYTQLITLIKCQTMQWGGGGGRRGKFAEVYCRFVFYLVSIPPEEPICEKQTVVGGDVNKKNEACFFFLNFFFCLLFLVSKKKQRFFLFLIVIFK